MVLPKKAWSPWRKRWYVWLGTMLLLLFLLTVSYIGQNNGYSIDPTDPGNFFTVVLNNDTNQTLQAKWVNVCAGPDKDRCRHGALLQPDQTTQFSESRGVAARYNITDAQGHDIKCIEITQSQSETQGKFVLNLSMAANCK